MLKGLLSSRRLLFVNLVLIGGVMGFLIAIVGFSCTTEVSPPQAHAQTDVDAVVELESLQNGFRSVAARVLPVVVEVAVTEITTQQIPPIQNFPFDFFFRNEDEDQSDEEREREFRSQGLGSGVIVKRDGNIYYVLTNNHVISSADEIKVILHNEKEFSASMVGADERKDLALIKFESKDTSIPVAQLGDSESLYVGDWVLAVGTPFGYVSTVTAGIVSALGRRGPDQNISDFIQTDAAINRGNSGGALVNLRGEVIGINTWIATPNGSSAGLGFAIPINNAKKAIEDFITLGAIEYGWLGVSITDPPEPLAEALGVMDLPGALVQNVYKGSPADKGGLLPGDYITMIDGQEVEDYLDLTRKVGDLIPNKSYTMELYRYGSSLKLEIRIGIREDADAIAASYMSLWPGLSALVLTDELREELELPKKINGVVISVEDRGRAQVSGLKSYDVVTEINGTKIDSVIDFYRELNTPKSGKTTITLVREGELELEIGIRH